MTYIPPSELILNPNGTIYHLNLHPSQVADTIILVGDPGRVAKVSQYFEKIEYRVEKREFITHTGYFRGKKLTVISTGIGTDNIDIVLNELDALVNIDFNSRLVKDQLKRLNIVRVGTSGSLQKDIPVDSLLVSAFGLGLDNMLEFYQWTPSHPSKKLLSGIENALSSLEKSPVRPYVTEADGALLDFFGTSFQKGITATCPGFYGPQGRVLRIPLSTPSLLTQLQSFEHDGLKITNMEMETAALFGLAKVLGHRAISCNALIANRATNSFSQNPAETVKKLIVNVLERIIEYSDLL